MRRYFIHGKPPVVSCVFPLVAQDRMRELAHTPSPGTYSEWTWKNRIHSFVINLIVMRNAATQLIEEEMRHTCSPQDAVLWRSWVLGLHGPWLKHEKRVSATNHCPGHRYKPSPDLLATGP